MLELYCAWPALAELSADALLTCVLRRHCSVSVETGLPHSEDAPRGLLVLAPFLCGVICKQYSKGLIRQKLRVPAS